MNKASITTLTGIIALAIMNGALAQMPQGMMQEQQRGSRGGAKRGERGAMHERFQDALINKIVSDPEIAEEIGLTEEKVNTLKDAMYNIELKRIRLNAEKEVAALEQARLMTESEIDEDAVMAAIEKTGGITTELAKLKASALLLVKKTLTLAQIEKIKELVEERRKELKKQRSERRGERSDRGARRPRWKEDEEPVPPSAQVPAEGESEE